MFEGFGPNLVSVGLRKTVFEELAKPEAEQSILPYGTIQYFLVPRSRASASMPQIERSLGSLVVAASQTTSATWSVEDAVLR